MKTLITLCLRHRALVIFGALLIGAIGVRVARHLAIDAVPDVTNVQVQILTNAPSLGPAEVEQYVTVPIETVMSGLPRVSQVRSLSRFGLSAVTVVFEEGTDIYFARQLVSERLNLARETIPEGYGAPELGPISTGLGEIYQFEVRGEPMCPPGGLDTERCYTLMELRTILDWYVAFQLRPIPGVVEVNPFGGALKTYEIQVEPNRLNALGLSLRDVFEALEANNANAGGGYVIRGAEQRVVRAEGLIESLEDVRNVRVATRADGAPILIRDLGAVAFAPMLRQGAVTRDGRGEVVTASVMMLMGANSRTVAADVRARLEAIAPGLPPGVTIESYYDRAELVDRTIWTVAVNLIEGGVLVIIVLLLMLGNLRGGLLIASVIPLSLLMTFISMRYFGVSGNLMSLGALDFGLIIDGAIVIIENIARTLARSKAQGEAEVTRRVREATLQVIRPVLFGTAIIMIVYIPLLSLQGIEGKMFRPMAVVVLSALLAALILAITLVPAASTWLYRGGLSDREPRLVRAISAVYAPLLRFALRARALVILCASGVVVLGIWLASTMGAEFIPTLDEGAIAMQAIRPPSVSLEASVQGTTLIEEALLEAFPDEILTVISRTGRAEIATDPMGVEISDVYLMLRPIEGWKRARSKVALVKAIEATLREEVPGQNYAFSQPIELRTNELISGARADIAVSLYGSDLEQLDEVGEALARALRGVPGAADVSADQVAGLPSLRVVVNRQEAARYGLNAAEILDAVSALGGRPVGTVFEGQRRFTLQVRLPESARSAAKLERLLIAAPGGARIPLGQVAHVISDEGPAVISRERAQRRRVIQVNVRGRDLAGFVSEAQARVRKEVKLPPGYTLAWGGQFENLEAATERLAVAVPAVLALIFLLLYTTFGAARPALIIYLNIPVSAVGGVLALWLRGMPFSISAAVGFIALSGIAVLNGVVMVSYIRDLQREGLSLMDASERGAQLRLRAVLMTALTDGVGFLPMALSMGAGAEVQRPLATVVVGGLITATLLTLFVLPAVYSLLGGAPRAELALEEEGSAPSRLG